MWTDDFAEKQPERVSLWKRRGFVAAGGGWAAASFLSLARAAGEGEKIRIGQIGTAHAHAVGKMRAIRRLSDTFEVAGIVEPDDKQWEWAGKEFSGIPRLSEEELFSVKGLRAVTVETDIAMLTPAALRCVSRGLHVLLDLPGGLSLPQFRELHRVAASNSVVIQMAYTLRYNPAFELLFEAVKNGWLGEIFEIDGVMSKHSRDRERAAVLPYGGGVMFDLGCHLVDAVVAVLGPPQKVHSHLRKTLPDKDEAIDHGLAVLEYPKAVATVRSSLVEAHGMWRRQFIVCGTNGTIEIRPFEPPSVIVTLREAAGPYGKGLNQLDLRPLTGRYVDGLDDMARIIRGEKEPAFTPEHDLAVFEAVLQSSGMPTS